MLLARMRDLMSDEHFSVGGTLLEAWASHRSFRPKDGSIGDGGDFRGLERRNDAHASTTDPDARSMRKGNEAALSCLANALVENRNALLVGVDVRHASGTDERDGALGLLDAVGVPRGSTLGADKGCDRHNFAYALQQRGIQPHVARNTKGRRSAADARTARGKGYAMSLQVRTHRKGQDRRWLAQVACGVAEQSARLGDVDVRGVQPDPAGARRIAERVGIHWFQLVQNQSRYRDSPWTYQTHIADISQSKSSPTSHEKGPVSQPGLFVTL